MRAISLLGRDWPELGPLALVELDDGGALALSRGAKPKPYAHKDPNEDAALFVRLPIGALLAVADGFNGFDAAALAIERVQAFAERLVASSGAGVPRADPRPASTTCARACPASESRARVSWWRRCAARARSWRAGDAFAFRAGSPLPLIPQNAIVPARARPARDRPGALVPHVERAPGERVALVSDGVINFMPDPPEIPELLASAPSDLECAHARASAPCAAARATTSRSPRLRATLAVRAFGRET
jgi:hypothetical protein